MNDLFQIKLLRFLFVFFFAFGLGSCSTDQNQIESSLGFEINPSELDDYLEGKMEELNIPGLSIAIINDGEIRYTKVLGYADLEKQERVTELTIFEGASISKSVFAFFVMTFVEEGKLDLDKPLYSYYPHPDIKQDEDYKKITARMVLSHRSGFPNWREDEEGQKLNTKFEPGTEYLYSGEGFQYLAMVLMAIEKTDHQGLERLFQERIAQPLDMQHTVFIQSPYTRKHKAEPYDKDGQWIDWHQDYWFVKEDGKFYAPSSIHSEPLDFSKWMIAVMNRELLSPASYQELFTPHSEIPNEGLSVSYTLGFLKPQLPLTNIYLHSGNNEGFTSWYTLDVDKKWGYVLFTNSEYGEQLGQEMFFYLLTGPDLYKLYIILGLVLAGLGLGIYKCIQFIRRKIRTTKLNKP